MNLLPTEGEQNSASDAEDNGDECDNIEDATLR